MNQDRRSVLGAGVLTAVDLLLAANAAGSTAAGPSSSSARTAVPAAALTPDAVPPLRGTPPVGRAGDFDFLTGEWRIRNRSIVDGRWLEYDGEATVHGILGGIASIEELRIPARGFSGMGLRLLDVERRVWSDHWVNATSGVLTTPGQTGGFENGVGVFTSRYDRNGQPVVAAGIWDSITSASCRWRQVTSADDGRTWEHDWIMQWTRA